MFEYKKGNSFLHRCPATFKIIFIPLINIVFLFLPYYFIAALVLLQFLLAFALHFTVKEIYKDLRPVIYYGLLLFLLQFNLQNVRETLLILLKLLCIMQSASLTFKTSSPLQIREGVASIESFFCRLIRKKPGYTFTNALSLFIIFIPMLSRVWEEAKKAWLIRGGKKGIKMYSALLPVLFSVGMKKAYNMARAVAIRSITQ